MKSLAILTLILFFCSCSDSVEDLGNGYFLRLEGGTENEILNYGSNISGVPPNVLKINFNEKFIIVEQKPNAFDDAMHESVNYNNGRDSMYYWIIVKKNFLRIGPLNKAQFEESKKVYHIPNNLELKSVDRF